MLPVSWAVACKSHQHTCPLWGAAAIVGIHAVYTGTPILAVVSWTVIHIFFTVLSSKACGSGASKLA